MTLFVDTSVWFAAANRNDRKGPRAKALLRAEPDLMTSDFVLVETWLLLNSRLHFAAAERFWDGIWSGIAQIEPVSREDLDMARTITRRFRDQTFSIIDRTSFALMERSGISRAASFDDDFAIYRYGPRLQQAFEIVR